tara:strand:- start:691 stop:1203 length:513 start_codon:yes stop_codon:yes gene_type:complete
MDKEISKSLSGEDILKALDYKCNIVQYKDLKNYNNIDELLGPYKKCVILYHTRRNYGHFTCVYEYNNTIFFFDSYGIIPDDELKFLHKDLKKELNSQHRHLTKLLYNQNKPVEYNEYQLQKREKNIATCGRWVILRLKYPSISVDDFFQQFEFSKDYISNDELICLLIKI